MAPISWIITTFKDNSWKVKVLDFGIPLLDEKTCFFGYVIMAEKTKLVFLQHISCLTFFSAVSLSPDPIPPPPPPTCSPHSKPCLKIFWYRSGQYIISGNGDGIVTVWDSTISPVDDSSTTEAILQPVMTFVGHGDLINGAWYLLILNTSKLIITTNMILCTNCRYPRVKLIQVLAGFFFF